VSFFNATIANTVSAIRVGYLTNARYIIIPTTKYSRTILHKLVDSGMLASIEYYNKVNFKRSYRYLKYQCLYKCHLIYINGKPCISKIILLSKPTATLTISANALRQFSQTRRGILILSTSHGILTDIEAVTAHIGGIVLI
jgi:ribosomal protein S8